MALDRPKMIAAALELLDEEGLDGLTLRRLAGKLHVQAPALYWHFKNKQELLDEMASAVFLTCVRELSPAAEMRWEQWAVEFGRGLRRLLLRHRDGAKMLSGTKMTNGALYAPMELALQMFVGAGFSEYRSLVALSTIYSYAVGFVIEEQAVYPRPGERDTSYDVAERSKRVDGERYPLALKAGANLFSNFDRRFEDGLALIVTGLGITMK